MRLDQILINYIDCFAAISITNRPTAPHAVILFFAVVFFLYLEFFPPSPVFSLHYNEPSCEDLPALFGAGNVDRIASAPKRVFPQKRGLAVRLIPRNHFPWCG